MGLYQKGGEEEMPTYEYECEVCGYKFEEFQPISAEPLKRCPKCGKNSLRRLIGVGMGIIFRGSGFYETDYKRKSDTGDRSETSKQESTGQKNENTSSSSGN